MDIDIRDKKILSMYNRNTPDRQIAMSLGMTEERVRLRREYLLKCEQINDAETGSESKLDTYA